jgi:tetratricopeptide (TPR) repeat protein
MISRLILLVGLALAVVPGALRAQATDNDYHQVAGNPQLRELLEAVEKYHLGPGVQHMSRGYYTGAFKDFSFILNYFPNHPRVLLLMTELCRKWKNPQCVAENYFERALKVNPGAPGALIAHGIYLQRQNRLDEAIASYEKALEAAPDSVNAHYNLGLAYFAKKNYTKANEHAQRAYATSMALPALRDKLQKVGAWQPLPETPSSAAESTPKEDAAK